MATNEGTRKLVKDMILYLASNYSGVITTSNTRVATLVGHEKQTFVLSSHKLGVEVEGTLNTVTLTDGTRTAAQVVTNINDASIGATASADTQNRVKLVSDTAPTAAQPSSLRIVEPSSGTDAAAILGFYFGSNDDDKRSLLRTPHWIYGPNKHRELPDFEIMSVQWRPQRNVRTFLDEAIVELKITDGDRDGDAASTVEIVERHMANIDELIDDRRGGDRTMEGAFIFSEVIQISPDPTVWRTPTNELGPDGIYAEAKMRIRIRAYQY